MKAQRGFTLIELVVVIIVLGILAVTAAPKFIDLQSDARAATLNGAKGALQGANALVYAKAAVNGVERDDCTGSSTTGCTAVNTDTSVLPVYGSVPANKDDVQDVADLDDAEWTFTAATGDDAGKKLFVTPKDVAAKPAVSATDGDACQLIYTQASKSDTTITPASYVVVKGGC